MVDAKDIIWRLNFMADHPLIKASIFADSVKEAAGFLKSQASLISELQGKLAIEEANRVLRDGGIEVTMQQSEAAQLLDARRMAARSIVE